MQCQKLRTYMETGRVVFLPAKAIRPNPAQPRQLFREEALSELTESIRRHGILQPLSVRRVGTAYELIAGERRLRAGMQAGLTELPCIVMNMDDQESGVASLVENLQRQDLDCFEEAEGLKRLIERYGMTPTQLFDKLGMLEYGGGGFHCVWFDEKDMEIFRDKGLWMVTNPSSNLKLASGIAPICEMKKHGMTLFAIGTDGAASNNCLDMFREMFLVTALQKVREMDASACPAFDVLEMATKGGALAMGLTDCDVLAEGKCADFAVIDLNQPNMQPIHNIPKNLVYSGSKQNVYMTVVNGKILYENGKFLTVDASEVYARAEKLVRDICG